MKPSQASSQPFTTLREAIHHTATASGIPMKSLAADLDYSPSEFSMRTTLGNDGRGFPADKLIRLQELTGNHSILLTMADALGYELHPKAVRVPEMIRQVLEAQGSLARQVEQLKLLIPLEDAVAPRKGK